jgi:hypothetical protein
MIGRSARTTRDTRMGATPMAPAKAAWDRPVLSRTSFKNRPGWMADNPSMGVGDFNVISVSIGKKLLAALDLFLCEFGIVFAQPIALTCPSNRAVFKFA